MEQTYFLVPWIAETAALVAMDSILQDSASTVRLSLNHDVALLRCYGTVPTEFSNYVMWQGSAEEWEQYYQDHYTDWSHHPDFTDEN